MDETFQALLDLQELDERVAAARRQVERFQPEMDALEAPLQAAEQEAELVRQRLAEMRTEARRLERGAEDKRAQLRKYEDRLERVRNAREEAAAHTEIDLIRRAVDADETDAINLLDQIKRNELKLDEMEKKLAKMRAEAAPRKEELTRSRQEALDALEVLEDQRQNRVIRLRSDAARLYERIRGSKTRVALARLTPDGACGHCFSVIPLNEQNQIRRQETLHRCEACGVILYPES
jgi:predicted  nucleic acid-binding Zn-ribbon protein